MDSIKVISGQSLVLSSYLFFLSKTCYYGMLRYAQSDVIIQFSSVVKFEGESHKVDNPQYCEVDKLQYHIVVCTLLCNVLY